MNLLANGFACELPDGWEDRSLISLVAPTSPQTGFATNVVVTRERIDSTISIEEYAARQRDALLAELPGMQFLDERATSVGGAPAFQCLQRFAVEGGAVLQQAQTFVLAGANVFVITCTARVEEFDANIPAFRRISESFRLFDPARVSV